MGTGRLTGASGELAVMHRWHTGSTRLRHGNHNLCASTSGLRSRKGFLSRRLVRTKQGKGRSASCQAPAHEGGTSDPALTAHSRSPGSASPATADTACTDSGSRPCQPPASWLPQRLPARSTALPLPQFNLLPLPQAVAPLQEGGRLPFPQEAAESRAGTLQPGLRHPGPLRPAPSAASPEPPATVRPAAVTERTHTHTNTHTQVSTRARLLQARVRHSLLRHGGRLLSPSAQSVITWPVPVAKVS